MERLTHRNSYRPLAGDDLDVAGVTFQTLSKAADGPKLKFLKSFFKRPVYVVVDEVHHAGAKAYRGLIHALRRLKPRAMVGLTATPAPTSMVSRYHLKQLFPVVVYEAAAEALIGRGILSRPILTTINTNMEVILDAEDLRKSRRGDLPPEVLRKLENEHRNNVIVRTWESQRGRWGKSLVFATRIEHAEVLCAVFRRAGADARTLHSGVEDRKGALDWFRSAESTAVLISVGMLTEGVDLPDAKTAFLARPTTSRVLLKQMIGRVLRGPRAGGAASAEVVYFEDIWSNFLDVLHPADALPSGYNPPGGERDSDQPLPAVVFDEKHRPISDKLLLKIQQMIKMVPAAGDYTSMDGVLHSTRFVGYYDLIDTALPVFSHQRDAYAELEKALTSSRDGRRVSALSYFEEQHPPYPSRRGLAEFVDFVREFGAAPEFHDYEAQLGPQRAADALLAAGPVTESERVALIRKVWGASIAKAAYPSLARFEQAVERELRDRREEPRPAPDDPLPETDKRLPAIPRAERQLAPLAQRTFEVAREILPPHVLGRFMTDVPPIEWTKYVVKSSFGHWSIKLLGRNAGKQIIRINRLLKAPKTIVPDNVISFIIYHEMLHHLLPGEGHDAEFRELEMLWPDAEKCMEFLATLHERYSFDREKYKD